MSLTRPRIGVATEAASSQAIRSSETFGWLMYRSCWMTGSTGRTSRCRIEDAAAAAASMAEASLVHDE
jgi:hypothetical protein